MESGDHLEKEESLYEPFPLVQVKEQEKNLIWTHTQEFFCIWEITQPLELGNYSNCIQETTQPLDADKSLFFFN